MTTDGAPFGTFALKGGAAAAAARVTHVRIGQHMRQAGLSRGWSLVLRAPSAVASAFILKKGAKVGGPSTYALAPGSVDLTQRPPPDAPRATQSSDYSVGHGAGQAIRGAPSSPPKLSRDKSRFATTGDGDDGDDETAEELALGEAAQTGAGAGEPWWQLELQRASTIERLHVHGCRGLARRMRRLRLTLMGEYERTLLEIDVPNAEEAEGLAIELNPPVGGVRVARLSKPDHAYDRPADEHRLALDCVQVFGDDGLGAGAR